MLCQIHFQDLNLIRRLSAAENVIAAKKAGVNNYIVKPFTPQTFGEKLAAMFTAKAA